MRQRVLAILLCLACGTAQAAEVPVRQALEREFAREGGRPLDKVRWVELGQRQAALTALRRNLTIASAQLSRELSAAAYQQALAAFDPVLTQALTYNRSVIFARNAFDEEFKKAIECVAGVCMSTLANNPAVFSLTFDEGRPAGFFATDIEASTPSRTGPEESAAYNLQLSKLFPKGVRAFASDSLIYRDTKFFEDAGQPIVGSYERPWTNRFSAGVSTPLPGTRFFGDYAVADVALRTADINQQAAFWQIAGVVNATLLQVEQAFWNLVLAKRVYEVTAQTRERVGALAVRSQRRFSVEEATRYERARLDAQMATLHRQEQEALNGYLAASNALASLLDLGKDAVVLAVGYEADVEAASPMALQAALEHGATRNPSLRLAEANQRIAVLLHDQGRAQLRPDLTTTASFAWNQSNSVFGYESATDALRGMSRPDNQSQSYTLTYVRPWGNRAAQANFDQSNLRLRQQDLALEQTRRAVSSQITLAVTGLNSAEHRTELARRSRELAGSVFARAERQRTLGVVSEFELIVKSIDLLSADLEYQAALLSRRISDAAVQAAIGSLPQRYGEGGSP